MPGCQVEVTGSDGRVERLEVEATSVFDAGYQSRPERVNSSVYLVQRSCSGNDLIATLSAPPLPRPVKQNYNRTNKNEEPPTVQRELSADLRMR